MDTSGNLRLVIKRWQLKPKLWIINADDFGYNFFNDNTLDDFGVFGESAANNVIKYNRITGYLHVVAWQKCTWRI